MNPYERYVLPRLLDRLMRNPAMTELRQRFVPEASGDVLEIGIGSGLNLKFYGDRVRSVTGLDPSLELQALAQSRAQRAGRTVQFLGLSGEAIPVPDRQFDTVLTTWTLCTIPNPWRALDEMRRVLKPSGQLVFIEHGLSPERQVARWQRRINPPWKLLGGGCNLDRDVVQMLRTAGFEPTVLEADYVPGPRFATYMTRGLARRR